MTSTDKDRIVKACREIYAETSVFYAKMESLLRNPLGYKILYGPPLLRAPAMFIAYQPGGSKDEMHLGEREQWPEVCEYATAPWHLAARVRGLFAGELGQKFSAEFLKSCVAANAIFFRAPNQDTFATMGDPRTLSTIAQFCRDRVERLINLLEPRSIVYIGFNAAGGKGQPDLVSPKGRVLAKTCEVAGQSAVQILHLSGAQISNDDRALIREYLLKRIPRQ
jgi:hypothetical protein